MARRTISPEQAVGVPVARTSSGLRAAVHALAVLAMLAAPALRAQSSSGSYVVRRWSVSGAGGSSVSASLRLTGTLASEAGVGVSSDPMFVLQSGFWALVGAGPVPIVLAVDRSDGATTSCDLRWSGNAPPYEIFVAEDCAAVFDSRYATSGDNSLFDVNPPGKRLSCFNVVSMPSLPQGGD